MKSLISLVSDVESFSFFDILKFWESQGFKDFGLNLISGIFIFLLTWILFKIIIRSVTIIIDRSKRISELMASYILKIISVFGWVIIILTFLDHLGINMGPLVAGLGITGIILGLAFQDSLSNFFAGAMVVINEPFRKGDYIEIGSLAGSVIAMDLMCVTLNTFDGKRITMSNKLVWGEAITNYSYTKLRGVSMSVGVPYDADLKLCKEIFIKILNSYEEVVEDPKPIVEVHKLSESSVDFLIRPWVNPTDYWNVYWRFHSEVISKLRENGVEVPYPQLDVHFDKET